VALAESAEVVGREDEQATIVAMLSDPAQWPSCLVVEGEAGIGKTTLWRAGVDRARAIGCHLLAASPGRTEQDLAYAVLVDLFRSVPQEVLSELPDPQRVALNVAIQRAEGKVNLLSLRAGVLGILGVMLREGPVVLAIDDCQWIDASSAGALDFAFARVDGPLGLMLARRLEPDSNGHETDVERRFRGPITRILVPPLPVRHLEQLVTTRFGSVRQEYRRRACELAGGNPFYGLELTSAYADGGLPDGQLLPRSVREHATTSRVRGLSRDANDMLLLVAANDRVTLQLLAALTPPGRFDVAFSKIKDSGLVIEDGEAVRFAHPLYRAAIYEDATSGARHEIHRRLAEAITDPERRAYHLSYSTDTPDESLANEIEEGARIASTRGAPESAAVLYDGAVRLTPLGRVEMIARLDAAGENHFVAGHMESARARMLQAIENARPGEDRADLLRRLGGMEYFFYDPDLSRRHFEAALVESTDETLLCKIHAELFWTMAWLDRVEVARDHAAEALQLARRSPDRPARALAYTAAARVRWDEEGLLPDDLVREAPELWEPIDGMRMSDWPLFTMAQILPSTGRLRDASALIDRLLGFADERGDLTVRAELLMQRATVERLSGDLRQARETQREALLLGEAMWPPFRELALLAAIEADLGDEQSARDHADRLMQVAGPEMDFQAHEALASLELSAGRFEDAYAHLGRVRRPGTLDEMGEPMFLRGFVGDEIEILVGVGRSDEAEPLVGWLAERGSVLNRPMTLALAERGRGLLREAEGDLEEAERALLRAGDHHRDPSVPFDRARTLLILGRVRRRLGMKRAARDALEEAAGLFERIGARLWLERVRAETQAISGRRSMGMELSDAEERVARLAAAGRTNKEIATELSLSVRTVEGHLSRIYEKLGIRGRSELAASWLATDVKQ